MKYLSATLICSIIVFSLSASPLTIAQQSQPTAIATTASNTPSQTTSFLAQTLRYVHVFFARIWQSMVNIYYSLTSLFGWVPTAPLVTQLYQSRATREAAFIEQHMKAGISPEIAKIASVFDRAEDDYRQLTQALATESNRGHRRAYTKEIDMIDDMVDDYLDEVQETLSTFQDKAFEQRNTREFTFIKRLLAREFIREMID